MSRIVMAVERIPYKVQQRCVACVIA
jgi:hypothetical protein